MLLAPGTDGAPIAVAIAAEVQFHPGTLQVLLLRADPRMLCLLGSAKFLHLKDIFLNSFLPFYFIKHW